VTTCLAKDPDDRWQSARDVELQLASLEEDRSGPIAAPRRRLAWIPWAAAALGAAASIWALRAKGPAAPATVRFSVPPPPGMTFRRSVEDRPFALAPDGRTLAFIAFDNGPIGQRIFLRPLASLEARPLLGTDGARSLFWSPDGRSLAFFARGKLQRIDVEGAESAVPICDVRPGIGYAGSWGADGRIVFASVQGDAVSG